MEQEDDVLMTAIEQMHIQRLDPGSMKKYLTIYFGVSSEVAIEYLEGYELPEHLVPRAYQARNTMDSPSAPLLLVDYDPDMPLLP